MRITPLASGSQGNSLLLQTTDQQILVDAGIPLPDLEARLLRVNADPRRTTAVLATHRHRDHIRAVSDFCQRYRVRVYGTRRTLRSLSNKLHKLTRRIEPGRPFELGKLNVHAVALRHDAPDTVGFRFDDGCHRFAMATDLGCDEGAIRDVFVHLDALLLEFNYDPEMLAQGPYPAHLRGRVARDTGHLSNGQAASLLAHIGGPRLVRVWLAHISQKNNRPELALAAARASLPVGCTPELVAAAQEEPSTVLALEKSDVGAGATPANGATRLRQKLLDAQRLRHDRPDASRAL